MGYAILPMHDSFIIHHGLEQELKDCMNSAFRDRFGVDIQVDLKYNSIDVRSKQEGDKPSVCDASLEELVEEVSEDGDYGIYNKFLNQFRKYKN